MTELPEQPDHRAIGSTLGTLHQSQHQPRWGDYPPVAPYPYPSGSFPPPYPGYVPPPTPRNGLGTAALILAIAGLVTALSVVGGVLLGAVALLLGFLGYGRVKRREANNGAVSIAGIALGAVAIAAGISCIFIYHDIWKTVGGDAYVDCMSRAGSDSATQQQCADKFRERFENKLGVTPAPVAPVP